MSGPIKCILGFIASVILIICLICFGNPQWSRFSFWYQDCFTNTIEYNADTGRSNAPANYSGTWNHWNFYLDLCSSSEYLNGELHGEEKLYEDGQVVTRSIYDHKVLKESYEYYSNGQLEFHREYFGPNKMLENSFYEDGKPAQVEIFMPLRNDRVEHKSYYQNGQLQYSNVRLLETEPTPDYKTIYHVGWNRGYNEKGDLISEYFSVVDPSGKTSTFDGLFYGLNAVTLEVEVIYIFDPSPSGRVKSILNKAVGIDEREEYKDLIKDHPEWMPNASTN